MPEQFIKVRKCEVQPTSSAYQEIAKKQENARFGSNTNISNSNSDICRICHCEADSGNPLLSPCYCSGSLKYVHQSCLQQWLAASDTRSCELCKFNFILHSKIKPISEVSNKHHQLTFFKLKAIVKLFIYIIIAVEKT